VSLFRLLNGKYLFILYSNFQF
jgi:hypothetical protein